jgi:hypothetical protein
MATAPPTSTRSRQGRQDPTPPAPRWRRWLLLGLLFGLGYGLTQRLMEVRWGEGSPKAPAFKEKSRPSGTTLDELRNQQGEKPKPLPADLEKLGRQQREQKEKEQDGEQDETLKPDGETPTQQDQRELQASPIEGAQPPGSPSQPPGLVPPGPPPLLPPPPLVPQQASPPAAQGPIEAPPPSP